MRKTGTESAAYFGLGGEKDGFKKMKSHGFDCVDYQGFVNTETELFTASDSAFESRLKEIYKGAEAEGIEIYQTHGPWRYPPRDATPEDRAERMEKMKKSIWGTSLLHSKYMVIHPIMPFGPNAEPDSKAFREMNYIFYSELLVTAKQYGVTLCLENMPFPAHSIARPKEILDFVKELNSEYMAVCLDTGHSNMLGISPADALRELGNSIKTLHVHDNDGRGDQHAAPFYGSIDWEDFRSVLKNIDESVVLSIEAKASGNLPAEIYDAYQLAMSKTANYLSM